MRRRAPHCMAYPAVLALPAKDRQDRASSTTPAERPQFTHLRRYNYAYPPDRPRRGWRPGVGEQRAVPLDVLHGWRQGWPLAGLDLGRDCGTPGACLRALDLLACTTAAPCPSGAVRPSCTQAHHGARQRVRDGAAARESNGRAVRLDLVSARSCGPAIAR